MPKSSEYCS
jgi:Ras family protein A